MSNRAWFVPLALLVFANFVMASLALLSSDHPVAIINVVAGCVVSFVIGRLRT